MSRQIKIDTCAFLIIGWLFGGKHQTIYHQIEYLQKQNLIAKISVHIVSVPQKSSDPSKKFHYTCADNRENILYTYYHKFN